MEFSKVQSVILNSNNNLVVNAGAGSGKTRVLVEKYIRIFEEDPLLKIDQVVAITFTEKAAQEMKDRIVHELDERLKTAKNELHRRLKREIPFSRISTIHSFCSRLIRESTLYADLDPDFDVVTSVSARKRTNWVVESYISEHVNEMVPFFEADPTLKFNKIIDWFEEGISSRATGKSVDVPEDVREIFNEHLAKILEIYRDISYKDSALDFEDLLITAKKLLEENEELRERYANYFRYIFVDEFQDTNRIQSEIVELLRSGGNTIWYIGDPKQSIYAFRGADVKVFLETVENSQEKGFEVKIMNENYRSKPNLVEFYNHFFRELFKDGRIPYTAQLKDGEDFEKRVFLLHNAYGSNAQRAREREADEISATVKHFVDSKGYKFSDIAVLLRNSGDMNIIEDAFFKNGIPFYTIGGRNFFKQPEVRALYNLFQVILDPHDNRSMTGFLLSPFVYMNINEVFELKKSGNIYEALKSSRSDVAELVSELNKLKNTLDASKILKIAMERTNFLGKIALKRKGDKRVANVLKFLEIVNSLDVPSWDLRSIQRIIDRTLDENESEASDLSENEDVVRIMTVHRAKGLEFPVVILAQMAKGSKRNKEESDEEERRVLYVAMTRAKDYLVLSKENINTNQQDSVWCKYFRNMGYIEGDNWKVPNDVEELVKVVEFPFLSFSENTTERNNFELNDEFLKIPEINVKKSFFSATELFENFGSEPAPEIVAQGNLAHLMLERVGEVTLKEALQERRVFPYPAQMVKEVKSALEELSDDELILEIERAPLVRSEFAIEGNIEPLGISVIGKIDKIVKSDKGFLIIDFKYSEEKEKIDDYTFQIMLYMYLYRKLTGQNSKGVIFFLKDGAKRYVSDFKDEVLIRELKRRVESLIKSE